MLRKFCSLFFILQKFVCIFLSTSAWLKHLFPLTIRAFLLDIKPDIVSLIPINLLIIVTS